jgi:hypothetical protein
MKAPLAGHFDSDTRDDIFWYSETGTDKLSWGSTARTFSTVTPPFNLSSSYSLQVADYDGNSTSDIYSSITTNASERIFYGSMKP